MFSKYDVYTTVQSMYCYPDTDVLINKLDIHDKTELKQAEEEFTAVKQMALLQEPIKGRFTKTHLFRIHRFLFEDVYPFAGHIRKEQISKGDTMFYPPDLIDRELERVFKNIHANKLLAEHDEEKQIQTDRAAVSACGSGCLRGQCGAGILVCSAAASAAGAKCVPIGAADPAGAC